MDSKEYDRRLKSLVDFESHVLNVVPDETLMMSRKDCHAKDVSSIVIGGPRNGNWMNRVFLAWDTHPLWTNRPVIHTASGDIGYQYSTTPLAVGIHDHRYDIKLSFISGNPVNDIWEEGRGKNECQFVAWIFESGEMRAPPKLERIGQLMLHRIYEEPVQVNTLGANQLHTIYVPKNESAAWCVFEGYLRRTRTRLFTTTKEANCDGLYREFESPRDVKEHVSKFVAHAREELKVKFEESFIRG